MQQVKVGPGLLWEACMGEGGGIFGSGEKGEGWSWKTVVNTGLLCVAKTNAINNNLHPTFTSYTQNNAVTALFSLSIFCKKSCVLCLGVKVYMPPLG